MIYIGADHRGFQLKEAIRKHLDTLDIEVTDVGAYTLNKDDDYNEYASEVAKYTRLKVGNVGILFCGSGNGEAIVANKHKDIRCAVCVNLEQAKQAKEHLAANVMSIPADIVDFNLAQKMVMIFIQTAFSLEKRHNRRLTKILEMEKNGLV